MVVLYVLKNNEVEIVFKLMVGRFIILRFWVIFSEESIGIAALYSYGIWLVVVSGWVLFIDVLVFWRLFLETK